MSNRNKANGPIQGPTLALAQAMLSEMKKTYVMADQHVIHEGGKVQQHNATDISFF